MAKKIKKRITLGSKEVTYDKEAKALYIYLKIVNSEEVVTTKEDNHLVIIDRDKDGKAVGVEIIGIKL